MNSKQIQDPKSDKTVAVMIGADLYNDLKGMISGTGFSSVDDYVTYLLRSQIGKKKGNEELSTEDSEIVTARLKALGYI